MKCANCQLADAEIGVLCESCRDELVGTVAFTRQQIQVHGPTTSVAGLVDVWGGVHRLSLHTTIGRTTEPPSLTILEPSVSRRHASIEHTPKGWFVMDLGSAHGTFVDEWSAEAPLPIKSGNLLRLGALRFLFLEDVSGLAVPDDLDGGQTHKPSAPLTLGVIKYQTRDLERITLLPTVALRLHEPTGGGGGVIEIEGKRVQLTVPQYELIGILVRRMLDQASEPEDTRGFIPLAELVRMLSLDSHDPDDDNIRHVVYRLRRACAKAGVRDLIETKYRLGYRLAMIPRIK